MIEALADKPATPFRVPPGTRLVRVDLKSGQRKSSGAGVIFEAFKPGTEPNGQGTVIGGSGDMFFNGGVDGSGTGTGTNSGGAGQTGSSPPSTTGGLY